MSHAVYVSYPLWRHALASISNWADEQRSPLTAAWHYVNFPKNTCTFDPARDCQYRSCVVGAINRQLARPVHAAFHDLEGTRSHGLPDDARLQLGRHALGVETHVQPCSTVILRPGKEYRHVFVSAMDGLPAFAAGIWLQHPVIGQPGRSCGSFKLG